MTVLAHRRHPSREGSPGPFPEPSPIVPGEGSSEASHKPWCTAHTTSPWDALGEPGWCTHVVGRTGVEALYPDALAVVATAAPDDLGHPEVVLSIADPDPILSTEDGTLRYGLTLPQVRALRAALEAAERLLEAP